MDKKKKMHPALKILGIFFIIYIALYIAGASGYYESQIRDKTILTEEDIKNFEEEIASGEEVNLDHYLHNDPVDYSNNFSKMGDNFSSWIQKFVSEGSKIVSDIVKSLF